MLLLVCYLGSGWWTPNNEIHENWTKNNWTLSLSFLYHVWESVGEVKI